MSDVTVFAPSPTLTVTVEDHPDGDDVHVHAGGQGVWQARMLTALGASVTLCCVLTGEVGKVVRGRLADEELTVEAVLRDGRGSAYVHDRRGGEREAVSEVEGDPLTRHELDEVYGLVLREGLESGLVILSGPDGESMLPAETYGRLAADLRAAGARVVVDLAGDRRAAALEGGVDVLKISDEELADDGLVDSDSIEAVLGAMSALREAGAEAVIVTRSAESLLLLDDDGFLEVNPPRMQVKDTRGAGDSLTAGLVAGLVRGESVREALLLGAAAGALNVTRHGLGTGDSGAIEQLRTRVSSHEIDTSGQAIDGTPDEGRADS